MEKRLSLCHTVYVMILYNHYVNGTSATLDCNFDQDFCNWTQEKKHDNFDWKRTSGGTSTEETGPDFDHTSGVGFYTYMDSSDAQKGSKARLVSPEISKGRHCLSFWYYMYGKDVGTIRIFKSNKWTRLLQIPGNVGKGWKFRQLQFSPEKNFKIIIEGQVKNSNQHDLGDIAIDDIVMLSGPCPSGCGDPTPEFGSVNTSNVKITSVVGITCKAGYRIEGSSTIVCLANGSWSDTPKCNLIDCSMPNIANGRFVKSLNGTTYNSSLELTCIEGYTLLGNDTIICQADGNWSSPPRCAIKNCSDPTPFNGKANSSNFQYKSEVDIKCETGYTLIGNSSIICQENGNWSSNPFCEVKDSKGSSALIAVYALVPAVAVVLLVAMSAFIWRKKIVRCMTNSGSSQKQPFSCNEFTNASFTGHHNEEELRPDDKNDTEYECHNTSYKNPYNILEADTKPEHSYEFLSGVGL